MEKDLEYLIVKQTVQEPSFGEYVASVFEPFTGGLWAILIVMILAFGLVLGVLEHGAGRQFEDETTPLTTASYLALYGMLAGPATDPNSPLLSSRIVSLGYVLGLV